MNQLAATSDWNRGDFNADGIVDSLDLGIWEAQQLIPEPGTTILAVLAGLSMLSLRRRNQGLGGGSAKERA